MKRTLSIILIAAMLISMLAIMPVTVVAEPVGTAVSNATEFAAMSPSGQYYLTASFTVSVTYSDTFTGTFDGNGKTITTSVPLFDEVSGTIKNLTVGGTVNYSEETGSHAGAVAKVANGATFTSVTNNAAVSGYTTTADAANIPAAGGVVGYVTGNCTFTTVSNTGNVNGYNAGGIAGMVANSASGVTTFTGCTNSGAITADSTITANAYDGSPTGNLLGTGGIVGTILDYGKVYFNSCSNSGVVNNSESATDGTKNTASGGIYGNGDYISATPADLYVYVTDCSNTGAITARNQAGGIAGFAHWGNLVAYNCTNSGAIVSTQNYSGGVFGRAGDTSFSIISCTNEATGTVAGADGQISGVVGYGAPSQYSEIIDCTNNADISNSAATIDISGIGTFKTSGGLLIAGCINNGDLTNTKSATDASYVAGISERLEGNNITVSDCINTGAISGKQDTGGIIAIYQSANGVISNCVNTGAITLNATDNNYSTAGIVAKMVVGSDNCIVTDCLNTGVVVSLDKGTASGIAGRTLGSNITVSNSINKGNITGKWVIGGIVGYAEKVLTIEYCLNDATVSGTGTSGYCGGIISRIGTDTVVDEVTTIKNCVNNGFIDSRSNQGGGIVSYSRRALYIENCYNYGAVSSPKWSGGIVGYQRDLYGDYINCINYGNITTTSTETTSRAAGIVAYTTNSGTYTHTNLFYNCGNEGTINSYSHAAGIIGQFTGGSATKNIEIKYCYNTGDITSTAGSVAGLAADVGGIADPVCQYNYVSGTLTATAGSTYATIRNSTTGGTTNLHHNYIAEGTADYLCYYGANVASAASNSNFVASELTSGKLANDINTAVGSDVFYETLGTDTHPTTDKSHKAVRLSASVYSNLKKASFIIDNSITFNSVTYDGVNEVSYIDTLVNTDVTVPEKDGVFYWYTGSDVALPSSTIQLTADKEFTAITSGINTSAGASVRLGTPTGLRFSGDVTQDFIAPLCTKYGSANVSFGMIITPTAYVTAAGEFTIEKLDDAGKTYNIVPAWSIANIDDVDTDGYYKFNAVLSNVKDTNYANAFSAITYIKIVEGANTTYIYAASSTSRSINVVSNSALNDVSSVQSANYSNLIVGGVNNGKYSPYTATHRIILESFNPSNYLNSNGTVITCAHRANSNSNTDLPENSIPAINNAIADGATMLELDIRKTSDGYYVLCHDDNIYRTTTVTGKSPDELKVANMTLAQIHQYNLLKGDGEYYSKTLWVVTSDINKDGQGTSYKMATLQEVFNVIKNTNVMINFDGDDAWNNRVAICNLATANGCPLSLLVFKRNTSLSNVTSWLNNYNSDNRPNFCLTLSKTTYENTISDINTFAGVATMVELSFNNFTSTPSSATIQSVTAHAKFKGMRVMYVCDFNSGDNSTIWAQVVDNGYNAIMTNKAKAVVDASY